jgi:hypothetical protein
MRRVPFFVAAKWLVCRVPETLPSRYRLANPLQAFLTNRPGSGRRACELRHSTALRLPAYGGISGPGA